MLSDDSSDRSINTPQNLCCLKLRNLCSCIAIISCTIISTVAYYSPSMKSKSSRLIDQMRWLRVASASVSLWADNRILSSVLIQWEVCCNQHTFCQFPVEHISLGNFSNENRVGLSTVIGETNPTIQRSQLLSHSFILPFLPRSRLRLFHTRKVNLDEVLLHQRNRDVRARSASCIRW